MINRIGSGESAVLKIFGSDWPTKDGTCIRDYIHVMDLAEAHVLALDYLFKEKPQILKLNIGTGIGTSINELIQNYEITNGFKIPKIYTKRRLGDYPIVVADISKACKMLNWSPKRNLNSICKDSWNFYKLNYKKNLK